MTYSGLQELTCRIYPQARIMLDMGISLPEAIKVAIQECWLSQVEETDDHREMRRQLLFMKEHGRFDLNNDNS